MFGCLVTTLVKSEKKELNEDLPASYPEFAGFQKLATQLQKTVNWQFREFSKAPLSRP